MKRLTLVASLGLAACIGNIGDGAPPGGNGSETLGCDAAEELEASPMRRLARVYFENAVRELVSDMDEAPREALLAAIATRFDQIPFDISESYSVNDDHLTQEHVDAAFGVALGLAAAIADDTGGYAIQLLRICGEGADRSALEDESCLESWLERYGRRAFRRPLTAAEVEDFKASYRRAMDEGVDGLAALVGRLVAHPRFYYRLDSDGEVIEGTEAEDAVYALDRWELLSKLAFLFWAAPPNDELYDFVAENDITTDENLDVVVNRLLAHPNAEQGILGFYREWWALDKTTKLPASGGNLLAGATLVARAGLEVLPETHREDMIQEVLALAKHYTLEADGSLADILTSPYSFATTPALAAIYGVDPWDGDPSHLVALPEGERAGLLTRAAFVASNTELTHPVLKGMVIRTRMLCNELPPPPPDAMLKPVIYTDRTAREAIEEATEGDCQSCHQLMNPLGFSSEGYDPIGRSRDKELRFDEATGEIIAELDIDTRVVAALEAGDTREIADAVELGAHIAESGQMHACMAERYLELVNSRPRRDADRCRIESLADKLQRGSIKAMLKDSVMQASFRQRKID